MKRHESLRHFSRDHHHGLVQARKLSLAKTDRKSLAVAVEHFILFWERELERHFQEEEVVLLPMVAKYLAADADKVDATLRQHAEIRNLVTALTAAPQLDFNTNLLAQLGAALRDHIRFEENELFPLIEQRVPDEVLRQMGGQLTSSGMCALPPVP
jgi:iron-sulfur cluster repair protein YtfE (RIC family)